MPFIEVIFPSLNRRRFLDDRLALYFVDVWHTIIDDLLFGFLTSFINFLLAYEYWITIELRIGESLRRRTGVIDDVKPQLSVVVAHACSAPDDLFEFGQRTNDASDYDVFACRSITTGSQ